MLVVALWGVNAACSGAGRGVPTTDPIPWSSHLGDARHATSVEEHLATELAPAWHARVGKPASGPPAVGELVVAVLEFDRHLVLLDRHSGERLWRARLNASGVGGPLLTGDRLYAATGGREGRIYAVRLEDGSRLWRRDLGPVSPPISVTPDRVFAATERGRVVALNTADGEIAWQQRLTGTIRAGVTPVGDRVFAATDDSLYLLNQSDGEVVARAGAPGALIDQPATVDDTLLFGSADGFMAALSTHTLETLWRVDLGGDVLASPAVARGNVIVATISGKLWSIPLGRPDAATMLDLNVPVRAPPAPVADGILIGTVQGEVLFVPSGGTAATRRVRVDGPIEQQPIVRDGMLLVLDGTGRMHAWQ